MNGDDSNRRDGMTGDDAPADTDYGGFVFGDDRESNDSTTADGTSPADTASGPSAGGGPIVDWTAKRAIAVSLLILVVAFVVIGRLLIGGVPVGILGGSSSVAPATDADGIGSNTTADTSKTGTPTIATPTADAPTTTTPTTDTPTADAPTTDVQPGSPTRTPSTDAVSENRSPSVAALAITDRRTDRANATVVFEVGWRVADPDGDLRQVRVSVLGGTAERRTIDRERFDVGGATANGTARFPIDGSLGTAYEVTVVAEDRAGNTALRVRREVAGDDNDSAPSS